MIKPTVKIFSLALLFSTLTACGIGQKKVLFTTRTNVGLDVDAKQFTAQLDIDRQEAVIGPTFEGGKHVPIAGAFRNNNKLLGGFGVSSLFAGGDAALALTTPPNRHRTPGESLLTFSEPPRYERSPMGRIFDAINPFITAKDIKDDESLPGPGQVKPFIFDTDTSLGVKLAWSGATGEFPDKVKIGFNREEFALAPVMATKAPTTETKDDNTKPVTANADYIKSAELEALAQKTQENLLLREKLLNLSYDRKSALERDLQTAEIQLKTDSANKALQDSISSAKAKYDKASEEWKQAHEAYIQADTELTKVKSDSVAAKMETYSVGVPSFFAAMDNHSAFKSISDSDIGFKQLFAAGQSATNLANNPNIRTIIKDRFGLSDASICLNKWLIAEASPGDNKGATEKAKALSDWFKEEGHSAKTVEELVNNPSEWQDFASKNISPGVCRNAE